MGSKKNHPHIEIYLEVGIVLVTVALLFIGSYSGIFNSFDVGSVTGKYVQGSSQTSYYWQHAEVAVWSFIVSEKGTEIVLLNNLDDIIEVKSVNIDEEEFDLNLVLEKGSDELVLIDSEICRVNGMDLGVIYEYNGKDYVFNGFEQIMPICS